MAQHFHKTLGWLSGVVVLHCFVVVCAALWHGGSRLWRRGTSPCGRAGGI